MVSGAYVILPPPNGISIGSSVFAGLVSNKIGSLLHCDVCSNKPPLKLRAVLAMRSKSSCNPTVLRGAIKKGLQLGYKKLTYAVMLNDYNWIWAVQWSAPGASRVARLGLSDLK